MQILFKHKKMLVIIIAVVVFALWAVMVFDINKRLPAAKYEEYSPRRSALYNGLSITPQNNQLYSWEEFKKAYPNNREYDDWKHEELDRLVVYQLNVKNVSTEDVIFYPVYLRMFDEKSCIGNGVTVLDNEYNSVILSPDEESTVKVVSYICESRLPKRTILDLNTENLKLSLTYYPTNIVLSFGGAKDE